MACEDASAVERALQQGGGSGRAAPFDLFSLSSMQCAQGDGGHLPFFWYIDRPWVARGDYFRSNPLPTRGRCKAYFRAPSHRSNLPAWEEEEIAPGTFLGPVHAWEHSDEFTGVMVPHPYHRGALVWITVWAKGGPGTWSPIPAAFARKVSAASLEQWRARGWQDVYVLCEWWQDVIGPALRCADVCCGAAVSL